MEFKDVKQAFSPRAVRRDFRQYTPEVWPDFEDYERCIEAEAGTVTALYVGHYEPEFVLKAITRLSLYLRQNLFSGPVRKCEAYER